MIEVNGTDEQRAAMFAALNLAHESVGSATKDRKGQIGAQTYKYADLAATEEAIGDSLSKNSLGLSHWPGPFIDGCVSLVSILTHSDGGSMSWSMSMPVGLTYPKVGDPFYSAQSVGSALTYARRYARSAILNIVTEDDDGAGASGNRNAQNRPQNSRQGGYSDSPDNEPPRASYDASLPFNEEREMLPRNTASGDVNPSTVEALIKKTGFPHKGILGAYLKEKDMLTGYRAEDIAAWLSDNAGASGEELLFAAAAYGAEKLDGEFRDKAEAYAKANPS